MTETLLSLKDVKRKVSLGHTSIYKLMALGEFPLSIKISDESASVRWLESEIDAWIQDRVKRRMGAKLEQIRQNSETPLQSGA